MAISPLNPVWNHMEILLPPIFKPSLVCTSRIIFPIRSNKKEKKSTAHKRRRRHHHHPPLRRLPLGSNTSSYPRSSPTPLLMDRTTAPQTKEQLFDNALRDLEASVAQGIRVEPSTFSSLLEACFQMDQLGHGIRVHRLIPTNLLRNSADLSSKLLRLYAACGLVEEAHQLFDQMPVRRRNETAFAWNSLISGYVELGLFEDAMALYYQMDEDGVEPDRFTFPRVLKACAGLGSIAIGEAVHRHAIRSGFGTDPFVLNALVDMYAKCGDIVKARRAFDMVVQRDMVSWNSMLTGYARHGLCLEALSICREMLLSGFEPDSVSISTILTGFPSMSRFGDEIHAWALRRGLEKHTSVANALISMYSEQGCLERARTIFSATQTKDVVSWNAIISAHRHDHRALLLFQHMEDSGVPPDHVTFVSLLSACANLGLVEEGWELFAKMEEKYRIKARMEHYSCMVNLLGRAGEVDEAYKLIVERVPFDGGPTVWGALLYACSLNGNTRVGEIAADRLFELEPDNAHNFELMMKVYEIAGRWEDMEKVRMMMIDRGLES